MLLAKNQQYEYGKWSVSYQQDSRTIISVGGFWNCPHWLKVNTLSAIIEAYHFTLFSVDCQWSSWKTSGSCSKTCGGGLQKSTRYKTVSESNGGSCSGLSEKSDSCNTQGCPSGSTSKFSCT